MEMDFDLRLPKDIPYADGINGDVGRLREVDEIFNKVEVKKEHTAFPNNGGYISVPKTDIDYISMDGTEDEKSEEMNNLTNRKTKVNRKPVAYNHATGITITIIVLTCLMLFILAYLIIDTTEGDLNLTHSNKCNGSDVKCDVSNDKMTTIEKITQTSLVSKLITTTRKPYTVDPRCGDLCTDYFLPRTILPSHYDLVLNINLTIPASGKCGTSAGSFNGNVRIQVEVLSETDIILIHKKRLHISDEHVVITQRGGNGNENVQIEDQFYSPAFEYHVIKMAAMLEPGMFEIYIGHFSGCITGDLRGLYLIEYTTQAGDTRYLAASQLQSTDARKVFPCFDEPSMKATFSVTITHSSEFTALSNMPVEHEQCLDKCTRTRVKFQTTPLMSTYLLAFVVSDFAYTEKTLFHNYTLRIWSNPDMINQTQYALGFASKTYEYFTDYFQISDVVPKADHVAVPDFSAGAMENWGLVIYREAALLYDPEVSSSYNKFMVTLIVAHEIAHTWFGNMVTMKWWDDLWLNEGFASTLMYFAMDHVYPEWNVLDIVVVEDVFPVMVKDALETSHPVSPNIDHPDEIAESFDQISYNKGMAVLRMLKSFLGNEGFRIGLQTYVRKYKYKNAEMSELWQTFTEATNSSFDIGKIMDTWTRQMGYPVITVISAGDYYILNQQRFLINMNTSETYEDSIYGYKWHVPFTYKKENQSEVKLHWLHMGPGKIKKDSDGWLLGNIDCDGFYRINYEVKMWEKHGQQLENNHSVIAGANRACLIGDAFNLARASILDYAVALNLTTYLRNEEKYVPWKAFLESLEFIRGMLSKQSAYVLLEKYIRDLVSPVFTKIGTDEKGLLPDMYLRRMILKTGCDVGVKEAIKYAKDKFNDWMKNGTRLPTDYSQVIYAVGIREGSVEEWDYVWTKSQQSNSPSEREMMLEALAHTQKPWLLWRYANWIFDVDKIKMQDVRLVMSYFSNTPLGRMIALHFLMTRWDDLNRQFGDDTFIIREMIGEVTVYVNSEFELRQLDLLFKEKPPKAAKKGADSALALVRANINWMTMNYKSISHWLEQHVESDF